MKIRYYLSSLLIFLLLSDCQNNRQLISLKSSYVSIDGQRFIDTLGRELVLHGLNLVNKDPDVNYLGENDSITFVKMKKWGMNVVRLGVIWDGLEPEPGLFDENYLEGIDKRIAWAKENNVYVVLDMHQDLFSVMFSDGAPEWATLTDDKPHITGKVWSEAYFLSPAVHASFDNFWANTPAPDGKGIQDHYIDAWKYLSERYATEKAVIGYDLMNEPFIGSDAKNIMPALFKAYGAILAERDTENPPSEQELIQMWTTEEGKAMIFQDFTDTTIFSRVFDAIYPIQSAFETNELHNFYQKTRNVIRSEDKNHIIFIEHPIYSNSGVLSAIQLLRDESGNRDSLVAYAPHGYDLVTDTDNQETSSLNRVHFIFQRIDQTADRLNMPVLVGEWGAFYHNDHSAVVDQAEFILTLFESKNYGHTYWSYFEDIDKRSYFKALIRPYPMFISGILGFYDFDYKNRRLSVDWQEKPEISGPTCIYLPDIGVLNQSKVVLNPPAEYRIGEIDNSESGYLIIPNDGKSDLRRIEIIF